MATPPQDVGGIRTRPIPAPAQTPPPTPAAPAAVTPPAATTPPGPEVNISDMALRGASETPGTFGIEPLPGVPIGTVTLPSSGRTPVRKPFPVRPGTPESPHPPVMRYGTPENREAITAGIEMVGMTAGSVAAEILTRGRGNPVTTAALVRVPAAARILTRLLSAGAGGAGGRTVAEETVPAAGGGKPPGITGTEAEAAAFRGAGTELVGLPITKAASGVVNVAQSAKALAEKEGVGAARAVASTVKDRATAASAQTLRPAIDKMFGPPKVYPAEDIGGHLVPPVNVSEAMAGTGTAGQVRSSPKLTGLEGHLEGSLSFNRPLEAAMDAGEAHLKREAGEIVDSFGVPTPTPREAGELLLGPPRVEGRLAAEAAEADLTSLHTATIRAQEAKATAARGEEAAQEAVAAGSYAHAQQLRQEAAQALVAAQTWDQEVVRLRGQVYGNSGPRHTDEQAGQIIERLQKAATQRADDAVDEAYAVVDTSGDVLGTDAVSLNPLLQKAEQALQRTTKLERVLGGPGQLPDRVVDASVVPVGGEGSEAAANIAQQAQQLQKGRGQLPSGKPAPLDQESYQALLQAIQQTNEVSAEAVEAGAVSFTQARRIRSNLGRIAHNAKESNPGLAYWAGQFKDTLSAEMERAAKAAGSDAWTKYQSANTLYKETARVYEEGLVADLVNQKNTHLAVSYLLKRDVKDVAEILTSQHLGEEARQALRGTVIDRIFKDRATGAWRTGKSLQKELQKYSPEMLEALFGKDAARVRSGVPNALRNAEGSLGHAEELTRATATAEKGALGAGVKAMKDTATRQGAEREVATAKEQYLDALTTHARETRAAADKMNPETALASAITKTTDVKDLRLLQAKVAQLSGPEGWSKVQARWTADLLDPREFPTLLKRVTSYPPDVVKQMIPDQAVRNRVYQLGRVNEHLAKTTPKARYWAMVGQLTGMSFSAASGLPFTNPLLFIGGAGLSTGAPAIFARILANDQAGSALIAGMRAAAAGNTRMVDVLSRQITQFLTREGLLQMRGQGKAGGPPPQVPSLGGKASGPGPAGAGGIRTRPAGGPPRVPDLP